MKLPFQNNARGFSMVEIMVIVVILGMIIAAGVMSYTRAVDQSRDEKLKAQFEQIRVNLELYRRSRTVQYYPNTLADLVSAGYEVPLHPITQDLSGYNYVPTPTGCISTSTCTSYEMQSALKSEAGTYVATPQTLQIEP